MLFDCIVIDGTVTANGVMHRKGTQVQLAKEDAERLESWKIVKIVSRGNVVIQPEVEPDPESVIDEPDESDDDPEITMQVEPAEQPIRRRGRRRK